MIDGSDEQSRRNCITLSLVLLFRTLSKRGFSSSLLDPTVWHSCILLFLASLRARQNKSKCSREPTELPVQPGMEQSQDEPVVKKRESLLVTYRPESILAWITALCISNGLDPQVDQSRLGWVRDIYSGLKYLSECSCSLAA